MNLHTYTTGEYRPGRPFLVQALWFFLGGHLLATRLLPFSSLKRGLLRLFGASIGRGVIIKPGVRVKFPWRLSVGNYSWIGENAWIDNLADVRIGSNSCISQDVYLCTGNHDWKKASFDLREAPISIGDSVWIAARVTIGPGVTVEDGNVVALGSVVTTSLAAGGIYSGNPAIRIRDRELSSSPHRKRILLCNDSYPPDVSATGQYLYDFAQELRTGGWEVEILSGSRRYSGVAQHSTEHDGITVYRYSPPWKDGYGRLRRVLSCAYAIGAMVWFLSRVKNVEALVMLSSPPLAYLPLSLVARLRKIPYSVWMMDINPHQAVQAGWIRKHGLIDCSIRRAMKTTLTHAAHIVTLDSDMATTLQSLLRSDQAPIILPLWAPTILSRADDRGIQSHYQLFHHHNGSSKRPHIVMYSGNLSLCHPLKTMLDAAQILRDDPLFIFAIVGVGPQRALLEAYATSLALPNVTFFNPVAYDELPILLLSADIHIISFGDEYRGLVHPSKIYAILASKKPFILLGEPGSFIDTNWVVHGLGERVSHGNDAALAAAIRRLLETGEGNATIEVKRKLALDAVTSEQVIPRLIQELGLTAETLGFSS